MQERNKKSISEKLTAFTDFLKNTKFLVLSLIILVIIGVALVSGEGENLFQSIYENIIGKKHQTFSPIKDCSAASYIILKDKLSRDSNVEIENAEIMIFEESENSHKYRVRYKEETFFYLVKKKQNGTWQIKQE